MDVDAEENSLQWLWEDDSDIATEAELQDLLDKARASIAQANSEKLMLPSDEPKSLARRPRLDPGSELPKPYFTKTKDTADAPTLERDPDVEEAFATLATSSSTLKPPPRGTPITKRERKEEKKMTTGPEWFDLPAPRPQELPELYKQVEALRLRRAMDPKVHARSDPGERKGMKGLPKYFAIGKVIDSPTPFKTRNTSNLTRKERKKSLVDELVADTKARDHAKRKIAELEAAKRNSHRPPKRPRKW